MTDKRPSLSRQKTKDLPMRRTPSGLPERTSFDSSTAYQQLGISTFHSPSRSELIQIF